MLQERKFRQKYQRVSQNLRKFVTPLANQNDGIRNDVFFTNQELPFFLVLLFGDKANNSRYMIVAFLRVYYFLVFYSLYTKAAFLYTIKSL